MKVPVQTALLLSGTAWSVSFGFRPPELPGNAHVRIPSVGTVPRFLASIDYSEIYSELLLKPSQEELRRLEAIAKQDAIDADRVAASKLQAELPHATRKTSKTALFPLGEVVALAGPDKMIAHNDDSLGIFRPRLLTRQITTNTNTTTSLEGGDLVCRVVARRDKKLPEVTDAALLPGSLVNSPTNVLRRLDDIYHAQAHQETRFLKYMQRSPFKPAVAKDAVVCKSQEGEDIVVQMLRNSLEDAGFERLSRRDLDLCEGLNAGYLLRLSILPDVSELDPSLAQEFYSEYFDEKGRSENREEVAEQLLFDGRVLVFWRGYSKEVTRGRLVLPKIDYLQASLVQRFSGSVMKGLDITEQFLWIKILTSYRKSTACFVHNMRMLADAMPSERISKALRKMMRSPYAYSAYKAMSASGTLPTLKGQRAAATENTTLKLSRYGGSRIKFVGSPNPTDALNPFIICEENGNQCFMDENTCVDHRAAMVDRDMYESLNSKDLRCLYDASHPESRQSSFQLLERVSISSLVDVFSREGRRNLIRTIFSKSELVEPTYEEVVVVWRPLPDEPQEQPRLTLPQFAYDVADMFDIEGLPKKPNKNPKPPRMPLEIRTFEGVPMANLPAVLPKTKLVFRPADAFVFDLVSIFSFLAVAGSLRFDNPKLDLIAFVSVSLWLMRTVFRYSNKLARYDLLVKKFLTSKISHRNAGALKYLASQAGSQRATRAALVHKWLCSLSTVDEPLSRSRLISFANDGVNALLDDLKETPVDIDAALNDLEDIGLVERTDNDGQYLLVLRDDKSIVRKLDKVWRSILEGKASLRALMGRRRRQQHEGIPTP